MFMNLTIYKLKETNAYRFRYNKVGNRKSKGSFKIFLYMTQNIPGTNLFIGSIPKDVRKMCMNWGNRLWYT